MSNAAFFPYFQALQTQVETLLLQHCPDPTLQRLLWAVLAKLQAEFADNRVFPALLGPYLAWETLGQEPDARLVHLGTAHLLFYAFLDITDDAEDHDLDRDPWHELGPELAINAGTALQFLALMALDPLRTVGIAPSRVDRLRQAFIQAGWHLASGQHRDLYRRKAPSWEPAEALETVRLKTGSSVRLYFETPAILAASRPKVCRALAACGEALGVIMQIHGDYQDLVEHAISPDLRDGLITYPVRLAYAALPPAQQKTLSVAVVQAPRSQPAHAIVRHYLQHTQVPQQLNTALQPYRDRVHQACDFLTRQGYDPSGIAGLLDRLKPL